MAIQTTRDEGENLTVHVIVGPVSEEEMYAALEGDPDVEPTALVLWDMSLADVSGVTPEVLRQFVGRATELGVRRQGGRTAVVAPEDLQYGLARMSEAFNELDSSPYSFKAFRKQEEAFQWLRAGDRA